MRITKVLKTVIIICLLLLLGTGIFAAVYLKQQMDKTTYFDHTTINNYDVSGKTPEEITERLYADYGAPMITLTEHGEEALKGSLADLGYTIDKETLSERLNEALKKQRSDVMVLVDSLMNGNSFQIGIPFTYDESVFLNAVNAGALKEERIASVDAEMCFDENEMNYYMKPEVEGNEFDDRQLQSLVKEQVDILVSAKEPQPDLIIAVPDSIYVKPQVRADDAELNNLCNIYNSYDKADITLLFGEEKIHLDWNTIREWLIIENGIGTLNETAIYEYVMGIAQKYNTIYYDRTFATSLGSTITFSGHENEYGYLVYEDGEFSQLLADINANMKTEREPVYSHAGLRRNGRDDLDGTYVEISIGTQQIWFYKNYELITQGNIVSGCVAKGTETQTGVFPLAYKESPSVLTGGNAENGWESEVQYWMPFFDGQGLHDASWRGSFGGNIYLTNGSHGCVNLPYDVASAIYNNIEEGTAIILYK